MEEKIIYTKFCLRLSPENLTRLDRALRQEYGMTKTEWIRDAINEKSKRVDNESKKRMA